jgi:hypothetical protein
MTPAGILRHRLENQALARATFPTPEEVVAWFGAVQAQDYLGALWALGLRMRGATQASVEDAETRRAIVRTWPMRGTLHFVAAADARWLTQLLAPRVIERNASRLRREVNVDAAVIARCRDIVTRALAGGRRLERAALYQALEAKRIATGGSRGLHILGWLAMEGTLCLAGRSGKQHTFALLDEWIPPSRRLERDAALAELATRYFTSHGPATAQDFAWWAGLTARDAHRAIEGAGPRLAREVMDSREYFRGPPLRRRLARQGAPLVKLLPAFDEYTVAYDDRAVLLRGATRANAVGLLSPVVIADGCVIGNWKRTLRPDAVQVAAKLLRAPTPAQREALAQAARALGDFLELPVRLQVRAPRAVRRTRAG